MERSRDHWTTGVGNGLTLCDVVLVEVSKLSIGATPVQPAKVHALIWAIRKAEQLSKATQKLQVP